MPSLAGVVSFELLLESSKHATRDAHKPFGEATFELDGQSCPWLKISVIKETLDTSNPFETSPLFEFGGHIESTNTNGSTVNVNMATARQIQNKVKGIGPTTARKIVKERAKGVFYNATDTSKGVSRE